MSMRPFQRATGNWAEDLGRDLVTFMWIGGVAVLLVPVLIIVIVIMAVT